MPNTKRQRLRLIRITMATLFAVGLLTTAITLIVLYRAAINVHRHYLEHTREAASQIISFAANSDGEPFTDSDDKRIAAKLARLLAPFASNHPMDSHSEITIIRRDPAHSAILYESHQSDPRTPRYLIGDAQLDPFAALALQGISGIAAGEDSDGTEVLAAYGPALPQWTVVVKLDLWKIRAPFIRASLLALIIGLGFTALISTLLYRRIINPSLQRLHDEEERYRALVELSPYGVLVMDAESGDMVAFNRVAHEQLGYSAEEFRKLRIGDYEVTESPEVTQRHIQKTLACGGDDFDTIHRTSSGELRYVHVHVKTFQFGGRRSFHTIFRDITEQKLAQTELEEYRDHLQELVEERNRELLEINQQLEEEIAERIAAEGQLHLAEIVYRNTLDGVFVTDAKGTILSVNPAFSEITGYSSAEATGSNPRMLKSNHQAAEFYQEMWATLLLAGQWQGEIWNRRKNGEAYLQQLTITMVRGRDGKPHNYVAVFSDITELRKNEERIRYQAYHDALTGLPNRILFQDRLQQALHQAARTGQMVAVMFLDLDRFKVINDTLGHQVGDELLRRVAERLSSLLRQSDTISRFGGDEFVILLTELNTHGASEEVAEKIITLFEESFSIEEHDLVSSTSIGIALYPSDGPDAATLMRNADAAMYSAKESGRNNFKFYRAEMNAHTARRMTIEHRLRKAIDNDAFVLHYQPRVDLESGVISGVEALIRWNDPEHGLISPADFIPIAEESGLIVPIGYWVLENACRQAKQWHEQGYALRVSVNISARQFAHPALIDTIATLLRSSHLPPEYLELELTETLIMHHAEQSIETLNRLKELGVWIAVDDFGTGYSSLSYLKRFPIDVLKVDKSFVSDIATDRDDAAIVETIIALGKSLRIEVLAEGVETIEQLDFLHHHGCHTIQGYFFSRPVPAAQLTLMLEQGKTLANDRGETS